jgi:hypothetical protein
MIPSEKPTLIYQSGKEKIEGDAQSVILLHKQKNIFRIIRIVLLGLLPVLVGILKHYFFST